MEQKSMKNYSGEIELKEKFREMIAENAYFRAQKRGFEPGHEMEGYICVKR